ncbi:MAG: hypothetical protein CTY31_10625 [Hyphomicrobium sp.]|nr:MAG: hypothetical protein CTY31_10625 [Hyphomicrobium sp.]
MIDNITVSGLKRLTLNQLRALEAQLSRIAGSIADGSAQRRRVLADLLLIRREIALRLTRGPRAFP